MQDDTLRRKRVALYARVSTPEQVKGDNIAAQLTALEAAVPRGADIVQRYADEGFSGTVPFEARPEGRRLLEDARRGAFDSVYARHLDRLGRSVRNLLDLANDLVEQLGISLHVGNLDIKAEDPQGKLILTVLGALAEFELALIQQRTMEGRRGKAISRNRFPGGKIPDWLTYRRPKDGDGEGIWALATPDKVEEHRRIFPLYLDGDHQSIWSVAEALGWPLGRSNTVLNRLTNPASIGLFPVMRGQKSRDGKPVKSAPARLFRTPADIQKGRDALKEGTFKELVKKMIHEAGWIAMEVPAVIDEDKWLAAQQRLIDNRRLTNPQPLNWPLQGRINCGLCGLTFKCRRNHGKGGRRVYVCNGRGKRRGGSCASPRLPAEWLEREVANRLSELFSDEKGRTEAVERYLGQLEAKRQQIITDPIATVQARIESSDDQIRRLHHAYVKVGRMSGIDFDEQMEAILARRDRLEKELDSHRDELHRVQAVEEQIEAIKEALQSHRMLVHVDDDGLRLSVEPYEEEKQAWLEMQEAAATEEPSEAQEWLSEEMSRFMGTRIRFPGPEELRLKAKLPVLVKLADEVIWDTGDDHDYVSWIFHGPGLGRLLQLLSVRLRVYPGRVQVEGVLPMGDIELESGRPPTQQPRGSWAVPVRAPVDMPDPPQARVSDGRCEVKAG
jgi:site-specific DNA recombinase